MRQGIYALASLHGAPLDPEDLVTLALTGPAVHVAQGFAARISDAWAERGGSSVLRTADSLALFLGFLDEPEQLAATLGLNADASPVALAAAALARFGADAPIHMPGEWTYLSWNAPVAELTLLSSETCRDRVFFATDSRRVALGPGMLELGSLPWVGRRLDSLGIALVMSRPGLRHLMGDRTVWQGIHRARVATLERLRLGTRTTQTPTPQPEPPAFHGSFEDAIEQVDALGRRIVRQQLARYGRTACFLSGGLDSALLTVWAALEQGPGREIFALCSAAPEGSNIPDERAFSRAVAERWNVPLHLVTPPAAWSPYRPPPELFRFQESPMVGVRHYLYEALMQAAQDHGAAAEMDGVYGEHSITDKTPLPATGFHPLDTARTVRSWLLRRDKPQPWPYNAFHMQFSDEFFCTLPAEWQNQFLARPGDRAADLDPNRIGIHPAALRTAQQDTATSTDLRCLMPFRDRRLLRLVEPMPRAFLHHGRVTRSMARALLRNRVPDSVRLRPAGLPFSPDYEQRLHIHASDALARMPQFREAGVNAWIDLDWLTGMLKTAASAHPIDIPAAFTVQLATITAEFLLWTRVELGLR